jgi:hypothetical protein
MGKSGDLQNSSENMYIPALDTYYERFEPPNKNYPAGIVRISRFNDGSSDSINQSTPQSGTLSKNGFHLEFDKFETPIMKKTDTEEFMNIMNDRSSLKMPKTQTPNPGLSMNLADLSDFKDYDFEEELNHQHSFNEKIRDLKIERGEF